jgi:hypothetical protein
MWKSETVGVGVVVVVVDVWVVVVDVEVDAEASLYRSSLLGPPQNWKALPTQVIEQSLRGALLLVPRELPQ